LLTIAMMILSPDLFVGNRQPLLSTPSWAIIHAD
jgi:hypothetical protein